jgi:hypothetical protein
MQVEWAGAAELRIVSVTEGVAVATFGNAVLCQFRGLTDESAVATIRRAFAALLTSEPRTKLIFFGAIETSSAPPDEKTRQAFIRMFDDVGEQLAVALVIIRGDGFRAAMVRVIASGILNFMRFRVRFPKHIGASLEEAASRATEHGQDAAQLLSAFRRLMQLH